MAVLHFFLVNSTLYILFSISVETQQSSYNILFINKLFHAFMQSSVWMVREFSMYKEKGTRHVGEKIEGQKRFEWNIKEKKNVDLQEA